MCLQILHERHVVQWVMRSFLVVSDHPFFGHLTDLFEGPKQVKVKQFVSIGSVEAEVKTVLERLTGDPKDESQ